MPLELELPLPANLEAERMILGCALLSPEVVAEAAVFLKERQLFSPTHRKIWAAMQVALMRSETGSLDPVSLQDALRERGDLDVVGGATFISSLYDGVPRFSTVENYLRIVRDKAAKRDLIYALDALQKAALADDCPAAELLTHARTAINRIEDPTSRENWATLGESVVQAFERMEEYHESPRGVQGFATGFKDLDYRTGGLPVGQMTVVSARPGMGKTSFVTDLIVRASVHPDNQAKVIAVFTMEMSREEIARRVIFGNSGVQSGHWRSKRLNKDEWRTMGRTVARMDALPVEIDDSSTLTPNQIRAALRKLEDRRGPIGAIVLDYLQFMSGDGQRYENRTSEMTAVSREVKAIAKEFNTAMVAVASMNRGPENRAGNRPQLSDLRESGAIESDAACVIFPHRPAYQEQMQGKQAPLREEAELIVAKGRDMGTGVVKMMFVPSLTRWEDWEQ